MGARLVRVYPRMLVGGAESHILQLLEGIAGTEMVVPGVEGIAARRARQLAARYTHVAPPRLPGIVAALAGADIVHIHTVNNEPLLPIAVQLAGPGRIVQTIHNNFEAQYCRLVDHSFVVGIETAAMQSTPALISPLPEGVVVPDTLPPAAPLAGRPLRVVEVRREDKPMSFTVEELLAAGALAGEAVEVVVVGVGGASSDDRVRRVGERDDPTPWIAWADILVHASAAETFGRTAYEALAQGAVPVLTPLPAFTQRLGERAFITADHSIASGVSLLNRVARWVAEEPEEVARRRAAGHAWVQSVASIPHMVAAQRAGYAQVLAAPPAPRSFFPGDVPADALPQLGDVLERILARERISDETITALPPGAQAIALWVLADNLLVPDALRVPLLRRSIGLLGERPVLCLSLGQAAQHRGEDALCAAAFRAARRLHPQLVTPYLELTALHLRQGRRDRAIDELKRLLVHSPDFPLAVRYLRALQAPPPAPAPQGMFRHLRRFTRIVVTGPHRSGTTIAAEMIARDTGYQVVREEEFDFYREDLLRGLMHREGVVIQCPALFDLMPSLSCPETAIVMMHRPLAALAASRARMFAPGSGQQLSGTSQNTAQLGRLGAEQGDAAALKYQHWAAWKAAGVIHNPVEVQYASLAEHPLWVSPEQRRRLGRRWHNRRTQV